MANNTLELRARDIMATEVKTVSETTALDEVARLFTDHGIGGLPVTNETGHIVGVISVRDIVERYAEDPNTGAYRRPGFYHMSSEELLDTDFEDVEVPADEDDTAGDIMTAQVYTVDANATMVDVAKRMVEFKVHRLVVEDGGKSIGLVSTSDIVAALARG